MRFEIDPNNNLTERGYEYAWIGSELSKIHSPFSLLDIGCVEGKVLEQYPFAIGVDQRGKGDRIVRCDFRRMPFRDKQFQVATCISSLEHINCGHYGDIIDEKGVEGVWEGLKESMRVSETLLLTLPITFKSYKEITGFMQPISMAEVIRKIKLFGGIILNSVGCSGEWAKTWVSMILCARVDCKDYREGV